MDSKTISEKYETAIAWLFKQLPMFSRIGAAAYKPGLDTSHRLDEFFNHPHRKFKSIHIGGTNGKGSTSHMIAATLQAQGYKTGLYTSPHLVDFRERMKINGKMIPKEKVIEFVEKWKESDYEGAPSFFELTMMMAFDWFANENVDYAVIEVGMGGRLDSTNIITPELCVITNISHDHNQFLGETLTDIANEKAGIIKKNIPIVVGEADGDIRRVFENKAQEVETPIIFAEDNPMLLASETISEGNLRCRTELFDFRSPLAGDYQKKNINTTLHAIKSLKDLGIEISDESIRKGLENVDTLTGFKGRWTIVSRSPLTIADTGHNIAGIKSNFNQLSEMLKERHGAKLRVVIGFVADKAIDKILKLLPCEAEYYITNALIPRAKPAAELFPLFKKEGLDGKTYKDVETAYHAALADAHENDIIYIGGSTFIVADFFSQQF